jgi:hypothetical protein
VRATGEDQSNGVRSSSDIYVCHETLQLYTHPIAFVNPAIESSPER